MKYLKLQSLIFLFASSILLVSCGDDDPDTNVTPREFTVTIENVSTAGLIDTDRANGTVPMSPPVFALFEGADPMYKNGITANLATERIAEDGVFGEMTTMLSGDSNVKASDAVTTPDGPIFSGLSVDYTFTADANDRLQFMTMWVQSNDWFMSFPEDGIALFDSNGDPVLGDVSTMVKIYDSGTEADTTPGTGPDQKPVQDAAAIDQGPKENVPVALVSARHSFAVPPANQVIRITIK